MYTSLFLLLAFHFHALFYFCSDSSYFIAFVDSWFVAAAFKSLFRQNYFHGGHPLV